MRTLESIALRLRRNTSHYFRIDEMCDSAPQGLGEYLGAYWLTNADCPSWSLFEFGAFKPSYGRSVLFADAKRLLPSQLSSDDKLLHFSPTLVFRHQPVFCFECATRESGELNHGWAIRDAVIDLMQRGRNEVI